MPPPRPLPLPLTLSCAPPPSLTVIVTTITQALSPGMRASVRTLSTVFDRLGEQFGFQASSVQNQTEHLVLLLTNTASHELGGGGNGINSLHTK